ncbi:MAG: hypothetical protein DRO46_03160 [Candidatus Hecatellales archaeon]|nr:MAG: hypothetical protein DRO46_03160 [Candidatus Hecatellales archaeon]
MKSEMEAYDSVRNWLSNFPDRPNTRRSYLLWLSRFVRWTGKDPDLLIKEAERSPGKAHSQLKSFYNYLIERGLSSNTAILAYQALRSFYRWNEISLGRRPRGFRGRAEYASSYVLTQEDVASMVAACDNIRDKALIAFLAQSGQRCGVIAALKVKHVRVGLERKTTPLIVNVPPVLRDGRGVNVNKLGEAYRFAIGKDAISLVREMLKERKEAGEPLHDESWLFRSYSVKREGYSKPVKVSRSAEGPPLTTSAIRQIVHEAALKAGLQRKASAKRYEIYPHSFRRYWNMRMQEAGLSEDLREFMLGHRLPYNGAYSKWYPEAIRREWNRKNVEKYIEIFAYFSTEFA